VKERAMPRLPPCTVYPEIATKALSNAGRSYPSKDPTPVDFSAPAREAKLEFLIEQLTDQLEPARVLVRRMRRASNANYIPRNELKLLEDASFAICDRLDEIREGIYELQLISNRAISEARHARKCKAREGAR
jgi:hypothetical protein